MAVRTIYSNSLQVNMSRILTIYTSTMFRMAELLLSTFGLWLKFYSLRMLLFSQMADWVITHSIYSAGRLFKYLLHSLIGWFADQLLSKLV
jgi:hypothetical protein